jgi:uncharacterized repeat protein (TIGR03843 family)
VTAAELDEQRTAEILGRGEMTVHGRIAGSSNATLLVTCCLDGVEMLAVYKPERGERSLWDFPRGLHRREVATYRMSEALGLNCVPETIERDEGPFGLGSVQRFVAEDGESHYFTLREDAKWWPALKAIAALDCVINNADRKSGHVLLADDKLWAIDHGLSFHTESKLRTVIWDFADEGLPDFVVRGLESFLDASASSMAAEFEDLLSRDERHALVGRAKALLKVGKLPEPVERDGGWPPYPWPLV